MVTCVIFAYNYFRLWAGFLAINQYFPTRLIGLQFLQRAAIIACKSCACNCAIILALGGPPLQELHAIIAHVTIALGKLAVGKFPPIERLYMAVQHLSIKSFALSATIWL